MFLLLQGNLHLFEQVYLQNQLKVLEHVDIDHPIQFDHMNEKIDHVNEENVEENEILYSKKKEIIRIKILSIVIYVRMMVMLNVYVLMLLKKMIHEVEKYEKNSINPNDTNKKSKRLIIKIIKDLHHLYSLISVSIS